MRTEGENQPGDDQGLIGFGLMVISYRRWLLGLIAFLEIPYLQQRLAEAGIDWELGRFRGPRMLDSLWNFVAGSPVESMVIGSALWLIVAATLGGRRFWLAARRSTSVRGTDSERRERMVS